MTVQDHTLLAPYYADKNVTLYHADCLDVMPVLEAGSIDMVLCDLPYGTTACKWDSVIPFESLWAQYDRLLRDRGAAVLTASNPFTAALLLSKPEWYRHGWVWVKNIASGHLSAKKRPMKKHEDILVFGREAVTYNPQMHKGPRKASRVGSPESRRRDVGVHTGSEASRTNLSIVYTDTYYPTTVLDFECVRRADSLHPTQKPVALFEYLICTYTNEGELVLDNCAGSGTTGMAAVAAGRKAILIDSDEHYCEIAANRLAAGCAERAA